MRLKQTTIFLALMLSLLSLAAGACFATVMNGVNSLGTPAGATGTPLPVESAQPGHTTPGMDETTPSQSAGTLETGQEPSAEPEGAGYVGELLEALEREYERRMQAERRLAREQVRQARRDAAPPRPAPPVVHPTSAAPQPSPRAVPATKRRIVTTPPTAVVVPPRRPVDAAEQQAATGTIAAGTTIRATVDTPTTSDQSQPGDRVTATVRSTISDNGRVLLRNGDQLIGSVTAVENSGRMRGSEALTVDFHAVRIDGSEFEMETGSVTRTGPGQGKQNTTRIGGGAAAARYWARSSAAGTEPHWAEPSGPPAEPPPRPRSGRRRQPSKRGKQSCFGPRAPRPCRRTRPTGR